MYELTDLQLSYGEAKVLCGLSTRFSAGEFVSIAGPNGAGKSTLLGVMAGLRTQYSGSCRLHSREVRDWNRRQFAREVSVVPQSARIEFPFTAEQVVLMGRTPFLDSLFESAEDLAAVERAMELTGTLPFRSRDFRSLSGGERQRVILASALAQSPRVLLLDEPTTFLDVEHQIHLYTLLRDLCRGGLLAIAVSHDLNLAASYSQRMVLLHGGTIVANGEPESVLNPKSMRDVFRVDTQILNGPNGRPWIHYGSG